MTCLKSFLDCQNLNNPDREYWLSVTSVVHNCDVKSGDNKYSFGMFADAFMKEVASGSFYQRYFYGLWWGLRNLRYI